REGCGCGRRRSGDRHAGRDVAGRHRPRPGVLRRPRRRGVPGGLRRRVHHRPGRQPRARPGRPAPAAAPAAWRPLRPVEMNRPATAAQPHRTVKAPRSHPERWGESHGEMEEKTMKAIRAHDRKAGADGLVLEDVPYPHASENDVIVKVHAASFTRGELDWPGTWTDRAGRDRAPTIPGHEVSGVVAELGLGTTGLTVGQRVFGLTDWTRDGTLAEYVAVEARNLAPLPATIDHVQGAALPMAGLTAWQGL